MKKATQAIVLKDLEPYTHNDGSVMYIEEKDVKELTMHFLLGYSNLYCGTDINSAGERFFVVKTSTGNRKFAEIIVR